MQVNSLVKYKDQFKEIYISYYARMKRFAQQYVIREEDAENLVHDKTVYDPCPAGWRVPAIEDYSDLADEHFNKDVEGGHLFIHADQSNFFAFTGYREVQG